VCAGNLSSFNTLLSLLSNFMDLGMNVMPLDVIIVRNLKFPTTSNINVAVMAVVLTSEVEATLMPFNTL